MLIKNKTFLWKHKNTAFWQKTRQKHGILAKSRFPWFLCFHDYLLSLCTSHQKQHLTLATLPWMNGGLLQLYSVAGDGVNWLTTFYLLCISNNHSVMPGTLLLQLVVKLLKLEYGTNCASATCFVAFSDLAELSITNNNSISSLVNSCSQNMPLTTY